jgi:uncharacterized membrane protein YeaQ/YmgE (transglycosylase-associated protein family)
MTTESFLWSLLLGAIAGWLAGVMFKSDGFGVPGNIVVGAIGALIGGWLFAGAYGGVGAVIAAAMGAIILLFLLRVVRRVA